MAQYFARPIRRLVGATKKVAEGRFEFTAQDGRRDEIGEFSVAFEEMTGALRASRESLELRTAALKTAVERLLVEVYERKTAEGALQKAHDELEIRVAVRATQLSMTIENLVKEIAERNRAQEQVKASLREKEVLLKEVHHRVKNNLQIIYSLLHLQSGYVKDDEARHGFQESQGRVRSMALIHEQLYQSGDLARIDFGEYVRSLSANLLRAYEVDSEVAVLKIDCGDVRLAIDTAIPCGLIMNELVTNSLKYAFPEATAAQIRISLHSRNGNEITLRVHDNGVGLPEGLDFRNTESLGLQLVSTLTEQIGGTIELDSRAGTDFVITFPARKDG